SSVYENKPQADLCFKSHDLKLLTKIDSVYHITLSDSFLESKITKTDFIYDKGYLSKRISFSNIEDSDSNNPYLIFSTTNIIYSANFDKCITNEVIEYNRDHKTIIIGNLKLNNEGLVEFGSIIDLK